MFYFSKTSVQALASVLGVAGQMMGTLVDTEEEGQGRAQVSQMETLSMYKNWFLTITFIFIGQMSIIVHQSVLYNILVKSRSSTITCLVIVYCIVSAFIKSMLKNVRSPISQPAPLLHLKKNISKTSEGSVEKYTSAQCTITDFSGSYSLEKERKTVCRILSSHCVKICDNNTKSDCNRCTFRPSSKNVHIFGG